MVAALLGGKPPQTPPHGSRTPTAGLRGTKFPLDIPSPQAGNGIGKSGDETPAKKERLILSRSNNHFLGNLFFTSLIPQI